MSDNDRAPTVYDAKGNPLKVRMVGAECEGDLSGEGHFAYRKQTGDADHPTIYFQPADAPKPRYKGTEIDQ